MALKALIFDVDGTLANTERDAHRVAFNLAFEQFEFDWHWSDKLYHELLDVTGGQLRIKHYLKQHKPEFSADDLDNLVAQIHALKTKIYLQLMSQGNIPLRPGVKRLIVEARAAGIVLAIATTTTPANVKALIVNTLGEQALDWFSVIGAGNVVEKLKPASDIYHYVLDKLNLDPSECIAFEDSYNGIVSSTDAKIHTLITVNEYTKAQRFENAMVVLNNLGEPDQPFEIIQGKPTTHTFVNMAYLQELYEIHS